MHYGRMHLGRTYHHEEARVLFWGNTTNVSAVVLAKLHVVLFW